MWQKLIRTWISLEVCRWSDFCDWRVLCRVSLRDRFVKSDRSGDVLTGGRAFALGGGDLKTRALPRCGSRLESVGGRRSVSSWTVRSPVRRGEAIGRTRTPDMR